MFRKPIRRTTQFTEKTGVCVVLRTHSAMVMMEMLSASLDAMYDCTPAWCGVARSLITNDVTDVSPT